MPRLIQSFSFTLLTFVMALTALVSLSGCGSVLPEIRQFGVYKIDINQGNYLTEDMVAKLREGQTKQQVRAILGTPLLADPFHPDRWDYLYSFTMHGKERENRKFTLWFNGDSLVRWEGDKQPVSEIELNRISRAKSLETGEESNEKDSSSGYYNPYDPFGGSQ